MYGTPYGDTCQGKRTKNSRNPEGFFPARAIGLRAPSSLRGPMARTYLFVCRPLGAVFSFAGASRKAWSFDSGDRAPRLRRAYNLQQWTSKRKGWF